MRQKVVIACGLVRDATTLLFDEPLTGLDPLGIRRMRTTIAARARAGAAILLSSHLLHLVEEVCTRVIIMDRGMKIADGTVAELASRADLAAAGSSLEQIFLHVTGHDATGTRPADA
jgi:ABC-2 type transport system ATP-binding protein